MHQNLCLHYVTLYNVFQAISRGHSHSFFKGNNMDLDFLSLQAAIFLFWLTNMLWCQSEVLFFSAHSTLCADVRFIDVRSKSTFNCDLFLTLAITYWLKTNPFPYSFFTCVSTFLHSLEHSFFSRQRRPVTSHALVFRTLPFAVVTAILFVSTSVC